MSDVTGRIWIDELPGWAYYYDDGTIWTKWGVFNQFTEPNSSSFSWVNQGAATITTNLGPTILGMPSPGGAGEDIHLRTISEIATPYAVDAAFIPQIDAANNTSCGILFRESSTNKIIFIRILFDDTVTKSDTVISIDKFNSPTSFNSNYITISANVLRGPVIWLRMKNDGTDLYWYLSVDGITFNLIFSSSKTNFFTTGPNQVGFAVNSNTTSGAAIMTLLSWDMYLV